MGGFFSPYNAAQRQTRIITLPRQKADTRHYIGICGDIKKLRFVVPLFVCLRIENGRRDRDSETRPTKHDAAKAEQNPTAYRAAAQSGKNGCMGNPSMYSTHFFGLERIGKGEKLPRSRCGRA